MTRLREPGYIGQALDVALGIEAPEARRRALRLIGPSLTSLTREERGRYGLAPPTSRLLSADWQPPLGPCSWKTSRPWPQ